MYVTHKMTGTRLYKIFDNMKARCYNTNSNTYKWYGARGITICDEWLEDKNKFFKWAMSAGYDNNLQLDRINNNLGYCPSNCQWVTCRINSWNKRSSNKYTGVTKGTTEGSYYVRIRYNNKSIHLGTFYDEELAAITYYFAYLSLF